MKLMANFTRDRAIISYIKNLPSLLAKNYGKSKTYTPKQVKTTIERSSLSVSEACYGIAMFSGREAFDQYHREIGESCDYDAMRSVVADKHFHGNIAFEVKDIVSISADYGGGMEIGGVDAGGSNGGGAD